MCVCNKDNNNSDQLDNNKTDIEKLRNIMKLVIGKKKTSFNKNLVL